MTYDTLTKTVQYTAAVLTVGILLISVMSIHSQVYASENEKETQIRIVTISPAGGLLAFTVDPIRDSDNLLVQMRTAGSNYICEIPKKDIKITNEDFDIKFNTDEEDCEFTPSSTGGVVDLEFERNGETSEDRKKDTKYCTVSDGEETCTRIQEEYSYGTVDVTGTLFEVSDVNTKGEATVRDTKIKTTIKEYKD